MIAAALAAALRAAGLPCEVEARERLAVVIPAPAADPGAWSANRAAIIALARAHGFSRVALELVDE